MEIDNYMTVSEAADLWGVPRETIKNKLKPSMKSLWAETEIMIEKGLLKYYQKEGNQRREWIITKAAMVEWFGEPKKTNKKH